MTAHSVYAQVSYTALHDNTSFNQRDVKLRPIGSTPASGSVSSTGAATYSIPIWCPPGTNGMQPSVALAYNSQGGNGIAGMGWSIAGLSAITRVNKDVYHDGLAAPVNYTGDDRFALDGVRLVPKSGTYGSANAEYALETEDFSHIVSYGTKGDGPESFFVRKKDGTVLQYGNTEDSRFLTDDESNVTMWCINKILDINGNFIEFVYNFDDRVPRLQEIKYTGNINTGLLPYNTIVFEYDERIDERTIYEAGTHFSNKLLLKNIKVLDENNTTQKTYSLSYGNDLINSYLKEITEANRNGEQLNSLQFQYGDMDNGLGLPNLLTGLPSVASSTPLIPDYTSGDFNGDGIAEVLVIEKDYSSNFGVYNKGFSIYQKSSSNNSFSVAQSVLYTVPNYIQVRKRIGYAGDASILSKADFDGDGLEDVIVNELSISVNGTRHKLEKIKLYYGDKNNILDTSPDDVTPTLYWNGQYINNTILTATDHTTNIVGDFDGNGKTDLFVIIEGSAHPVHFPFIYESGKTPATVTGIDFTPITHSFEMRIVDFDGDGKHDIMFINQNYCYIYTFVKQPNGTYAATLLVNGAGYPNLWHKIWTGDFNGDGKTDVLTFVNGYKWSWGISTGKTFEQTFLPIITEDFNDDCHYSCGGNSGDDRGDDILIGDYNGDGKSDIMFSNTSCPCSGSTHTRSTTIELYCSRGNTLYKTSTYYDIAQNVINPTTLFAADIYGTGKQQISFRFANVSDFYSFKVKGAEYPLRKIADGFGNVSAFEYQSLSTGSSYSKGSTAQYPLTDFKAPLYVVNKYSVPDGIGSYNVTDYRYEGGLLHLNGRGFLGFKKTISETPATNTKTETISEVDPLYYIPYVKETKSYTISPSQLTSQTTNNVSFDQSTYNQPVAFYQKLLGQTEQNLLTGATTTIANTYDNNNFGTIISSVSNINNNETITTNVTYTQPANIPIPCMPDLVTVTKQRTGQTAVTDRTKFYYDGFGRLGQKTERFSTPYYIATMFQYDDFGNVIEKQYVNPLQPNYPNTISVTNEYELDKGRFKLSATNQLNQTNSATWDPVWGKPLSETGINGVTTTNTYNAWGKLTSTKIKANFPQEQETIAFSEGWDPSGNIYFTLASHPNKADIKTWFDKLGREVKTQSEHLNGNWTESTKSYNAIGKLASETAPKLPSEPAFTTTYSYNDPYKRLTSATNNFGTTSYSYAFLGNGEVKTTVINPGSQSKSVVIDATGKTIEQEDHGGKLKYFYDSRGNLLTVKLGLSTLLSHSYNSAGLKTNTYDISSGLTTYVYDAFGRLKTEKDSRNNTYNYKYNVLGLPIERSGPEGTTYYTYNETGPGASNQIATITGFNGVNESFIYDNLGRLISKDKIINGNIYTIGYEYNSLDYLTKKTYSDGFYLMYDYNNGYLTTVKNNLRYTNNLLFHNPTINGLGKYTQYTLGNKVTTNTYNFGYLTRTTTPGIQDLEMNYNYATGNLNYREDHEQNLKESFTYDNLNRLTQSQVGSNNPINVTYDVISNGQSRGNIMSKTDVGTLSTPTSAQTMSAKNEHTLISNIQQDITYAPFHKTETVSENGYEQSFTYDASYRRVMTTLSNGGNLELQRLYIDDYEINTDYLTGEERIIHYLNGGDGLFAIAEINPNSVYAFPFNIDYHYVYKDHLGSIVTTTDASQNNIEVEQNFDAWGRERDPHTWDYGGASGVGLSAAWLHRGYTGHEHMPNFSIVNMNGRMYDPILGRMMSPDPYVMPGGSQGYNKYTYALNNPLRYIDPSGNSIFVIPSMGYSLSSGFNIGVTVGFGWQNGLGVFGSVGYSMRQDNLTVAVGAFAGPASASVSYGTKTGWGANIGVGVGMGVVGSSMMSAGVGWSEQAGFYGSFGGISYSRYGANADVDLGISAKFALRKNYKPALVACNSCGAAHYDKRTGYYTWEPDFTFTQDRYSMLQKFWYSNVMRAIIPDVMSISIGGEAYLAIFGASGQPLNLTLLTRGKKTGLYMAPSYGGSLGYGGEVDGSIIYSEGYYTGDPHKITPDMLGGQSYGAQFKEFDGIGGSFGFSYSPADVGGFINLSFSFGLGYGNFAGLQIQNTPVVEPLWTE